PTLGADLVHLVPASTLRQSTPGDVLPAAPPAVLEQPMLDEPPRPADAATAGVSVVCEPASGVDSRPEPHPQPALESESNVVQDVVQVQDAPAPAPDLDLDAPQLASLTSPEHPTPNLNAPLVHDTSPPWGPSAAPRIVLLQSTDALRRAEPHPQPALESELNVVQAAPAPAPDLDALQLVSLALPEHTRPGAEVSVALEATECLPAHGEKSHSSPAASLNAPLPSHATHHVPQCAPVPGARLSVLAHLCNPHDARHPQL
ncbi:hypothetical protein AURDEDRAFT_172543, partial [Auricularia subglabra TFB-10046 SS5]